VGRSTHPWRVAKTRVRTRPVDGIQVHDPMPRAVVADLADVPAQPCRCHCGDRPMRCADPDIRTFACAPRHRSQPTTEWLAQQTVEAFPWEGAPAYLVRDNDRAYGVVFTTRVRAMGIRDQPISHRSPWQNSHVERLIGTLRRDSLDHVLIFGERHLRAILTLYSLYYNGTRTHLGLRKDAPLRDLFNELGPSSPRQF
jgi:hypothetical protein